MRWLPSGKMPPLPFQEIDWKLRATFGRKDLSALWLDLWWSGVAAGRIEGIVGTLLVVLLLAVLGLAVVVAIRNQ